MKTKPREFLASMLAAIAAYIFGCGLAYVADCMNSSWHEHVFDIERPWWALLIAIVWALFWTIPDRCEGCVQKEIEIEKLTDVLRNS